MNTEKKFDCAAKALAYAREQAGMTLKDAEAASGKAFQQIHQLEKRSPPKHLGVISALAQAYLTSGVGLSIDFTADGPVFRVYLVSLPKPDPKRYGWHEKAGFDDEPSGWMIEGGEEAYEAELKKWEEREASLGKPATGWIFAGGKKAFERALEVPAGDELPF